MMKAYLLKLLIIFLIVFSLVSCNDPIFYMVTQETKLIPPRIGGSPTNFAIFNNEMYVASGKNIFKYGKNAQSKCEWSKLGNLGAYVVMLAATEESLYALYLSGDSGRIRRYFKDGTNEDVNLAGNIQSIHASDNILFACARINDDTYTVHYRKEGDADFKEIPIKISDTRPLDFILNGVVSNSNYYYLCTDSVIFYVEKDKIDSSSDLHIFKNDAGNN
ncbi:hypothetical protein, partial [Treponema sp. R80B11-R83G3]